MSDYREQTLTCADCGRDFTFGERDFEPPKRCKDCRDAKKAQRGEGGGKGNR